MPKIIVLIGLFLLALAAVNAARLRWTWGAELSRKAVHVLMGSVSLSLPWLFDRTGPVVLVCAAALGVLLVLRLVPRVRRTVGGVLHGVDRVSYGEICFPVAIAGVFVLSGGDPIRFGIPILILTVADPIAALAGAMLGRTPYATTDGTKSVEGSAAFFVSALCVTYVPLLAAGYPLDATLVLSVLTASLSTLAEAVSTHGLDNATIPLVATTTLGLYLPLDLPTITAYTCILLAMASIAAGAASRPQRPPSLLFHKPLRSS